LAEYRLERPGTRRPFGEYVDFLFDGQNCDTDGNSTAVADGDWTELTIINRENDSERVDVFEFSETPLGLIIKSGRQEIAARLAYALAATCGGTLYNHPEGPAITLDELGPRVGDFDLPTALMRVRTVDDYDTGFVCKACGKWFADGDVNRWDTRWTEADPEENERCLRFSTNARCVVRCVGTSRTNPSFEVFGSESREVAIRSGLHSVGRPVRARSR
jgi:hypothetical protein